MTMVEYFNKSGPAEWISAIIAVFALIAVWIAYVQQKRRDQLQLAQEMIDKLSTDEMLLFATTTLDWGGAIIVVPEPWRDVVKSSSVNWNLDDIRDALQWQLTDETSKNPVRLLYRHAYVHLFNHLERMDNLLRTDAIHIRDLKPISWLANELKSWRYAKNNDGTHWSPEAKEKLFSEPIKAWYPDNAPKNFIDVVSKTFPREEQ